MVKPVSRETASPQQPAQLVKAVIQVALDRIDIGENVRKEIPDAEIESLAASIKVRGVLQPIKVRPAGDRWVIVWGQRRFLAARKAGLETIPAITTGEEPDGANLAIEQLVENLHRDDLNPVDRARAMRQVVDGGMKQAELARELGLHPSTIANDLGLLKMPAEVLTLVEGGKLTPGHVRAISGLPDRDAIRLAQSAADGNYSTHTLESQAQYIRSGENERRAKDKRTAASIASATAALADIPVETAIFVDYNWQYDRDAIIESLKAAGRKVIDDGRGVGHGERWSGCDCIAYRLDPSSSTSPLTAVCQSEKHQEAVREEREAAQREKEERAELERSSFATAIASRLTATSIDPTVGRLVLRALEGYYAKSWTEYEAIDDAQIVRAIGTKLASPDVLRGSSYNGDSRRLPIKTVLKALEAGVPTPRKVAADKGGSAALELPSLDPVQLAANGESVHAFQAQVAAFNAAKHEEGRA
jgi:ParB family chromosome partitioning protein